MTGAAQMSEPVGNKTFVRVDYRYLREMEKKCPVRAASEVRRAIAPSAGSGAKRTAKPQSAKSAVGKVLGHIEFDGLQEAAAIRRWRERTEPDPALERWVTHAVHQVLAAETRLGETREVQPVSRMWARQRRRAGEETYEETVLGRGYEGGGIRELRVLHTGSVAPVAASDFPRVLSPPEIAFAAGVLAGASPVLGGRWDDHSPYRLGGFVAPRRVRVVEIGCIDGSVRVAFDGTREEAMDRYEEVTDLLAELLAGGEHRPGSGCAYCPLVASCPAVPSVPGLLGVTGDTRRRWSVTSGREHDKCPERTRLGALFLPRDRVAEDNDAARRGRAVHEWIEKQHDRLPHRSCLAEELPASPDRWAADWAGAEGREQRMAVQMIGDHAVVCPLGGLPDDAPADSESYVVAFDPVADAVVVAKTDLLYRDSAGWVVRETKTARTPQTGDLFRAYPQLALAVLLSDAGVLAEDGVPLRVELEELTGAGPVFTGLDTAGAGVLAAARQAVKSLAEPMFTDSQAPANPGRACQDCGFTRWCPAAQKAAA